MFRVRFPASARLPRRLDHAFQCVNYLKHSKRQQCMECLRLSPFRVKCRNLPLCSGGLHPNAEVLVWLINHRVREEIRTRRDFSLRSQSLTVPSKSHDMKMCGCVRALSTATQREEFSTANVVFFREAASKTENWFSAQEAKIAPSDATAAVSVRSGRNCRLTDFSMPEKLQSVINHSSDAYMRKE